LPERLTPGTSSSSGGDRRPHVRNRDVQERAAPVPVLPGRYRDVQGAVLLKIEIDADGNVVEVTLEEGTRTEAVDKIIQDHVFNQWRFRPALRNGAPVPATLDIVFELPDDVRFAPGDENLAP
jgi:TonB family protein